MTTEVILQVLVLGFAALLCKEFLPLAPLVLLWVLRDEILL